jgi:hypothetical protein
MFWKKLSGEHKLERAAPTSARPLDDADQALDTIASLLRSFGAGAFDLDELPAAETQAECESWAQRITVGSGHREGEEATDFRRDWGGLRRYFSAHRGRERDYVGRSFSSLREAVQTFARCMATAVSEDRSADDGVGEKLVRLADAFQTNDAGSIRKEAEGLADAVKVAIEHRKQRQDEHVAVLRDKIQKLKDELQQAREQAAIDPLTQLHNRASRHRHREPVSGIALQLK